MPFLLEIGEIETYQSVMRQVFEMVYYGHFSADAVTAMPAFERRYFHSLLCSVKEEEHRRSKRR